MARALSLPPGTVFYWKKKGHIPRWRHAQILGVAPVAGIDLSDVAELHPPIVVGYRFGDGLGLSK